MKKLLMSLITILSVTAQANQTTAQLDCHNNMYRESKITHSPGNILRISDSMAGGLEPILKKISKNHNLGYLIVNHVQLDVGLQNNEVQCQTVGAFPLSCTGDKNQATLHVQATFQNGQIGLALPISLKNLELKGSLAHQGPVAIGGGSTQVKLDQYNVDLTGDVEYQGVKTNLSFNTFFYTEHADADVQKLSACSIYQP